MSTTPPNPVQVPSPFSATPFSRTSSEEDDAGGRSPRQTSLDPEEINPEPEPWSLSSPQTWQGLTPDSFRHSGWMNDRQRVMKAFHRLCIHENRRLHFWGCGDEAWIERSVEHPNRHRIRSTNCRDRWCKVCQQERSRQIACVLSENIEAEKARFVTLTLRSNDLSLKCQLDRLYKCFAKLRARKLWKSTQDGGAAFVEVSYNELTERWHPHLHVICFGTYIPQKALSADWLSVTGDSHVVDVRWIRNPSQVARYVAKYASGSVSPKIYRIPRALDEAILALRKRRLCLTFGSWRGISLRPQEPQGEWERVESLREYFVRLNRGDEDAIAMWCQFAHNGSALYPYDHPP